MTWIKFCGTTNLPDALASIDSGANALGFIFASSTRRMHAAKAAEIIAALPSEVEKIGIFVNETPAHVAEVAQHVGLTGVQLHGEEEAAKMPSFRAALGNRRITKTLQARELLGTWYGTALTEEFLEQAETIDTILLDSGTSKERGGTGKVFDWPAAVGLVARIKAELPVIVAGGLNPGNVAEAIRLFDPWGVDVVSGVENEPGKKDEGKLKAFVDAVRMASVATKSA
jgi:phosphoribosylanthranilate isomerase